VRNHFAIISTVLARQKEENVHGGELQCGLVSERGGDGGGE